MSPNMGAHSVSHKFQRSEKTYRITWVDMITREPANIGLDETVTNSCCDPIEMRDSAHFRAKQKGIDIGKYDVLVHRIFD